MIDMSKPLTDDLRKRVEVVVKAVHKMFVWTSDEDVWNTPEKWTRPITDTDWFNRPILRGDSDDFMLEVYYRLRQDYKFPKDMLRLTVCATKPETTQYDHTVLAVEYTNNSGERDYLICDYNFDKPKNIKTLKQQGYRNFSMAQVGKPISDPWEKIDEKP